MSNYFHQQKLSDGWKKSTEPIQFKQKKTMENAKLQADLNEFDSVT